jgi:tricorn protease-like protein
LTRLDWKEWPGRIAELMSDPVHVLYDAAGEVPFAMPQGETTYQAAPEGAPIQALVDQLRGTIGLVILEAPPSRGSGVWYGLSNIAQQLGSGGVPAVVVLSRFLPPGATRVFLTALFEALVWGGEAWARTWGAALTGSGPQVVDTAVAAARKALTAGPDSFAWSVAALYSSTLGGVIFVPTAAPPTGARQTGPEPPPVQVASVRVFRDKAMRRIESVAWSPTGDLLAGGAEDGTVWVWSARDGDHALTLNAHRGIVRAVAWSPDGGRLATGSDDATVRLWSMPGGTRTASLRGHTDRVDCVAFSPDGRYIATCSADHTVRLWSAAGEPLRILSGHTNAVRSLAFSADGRTLYSGSSDRTVRLWRVDDGQAIAVIQGHSGAVRAVAFAQLGAVLATGSYDQSVRLWRPDGTRLFLLGTHTGRVYSVAFTPDGGLLASGSTDQTVRLWNVADGTNLAVIRAHEGDVRGVAWSPSGGLLATGSLDGTIRLWANPGFAQSVSAS